MSLEQVTQVPPVAGGDELWRLRKRRGTYRASLTSFEKFVKSIAVPGVELATRDKLNLEVRMQNIGETFKQFQEIQEQIELLVSEEGLTEQYQYREAFEEAYYDVMAQCREVLLSAPAPPPSSVEGSNSVQAVRLPPINLPRFSGAHEDWMSFRDTFRDLVHDSTAVTDTQKLHYLKGCLQGPAVDVIRSLQVTAANYSIAWELLCKQFDNSEVLIRHHVKALFALQAVSKESSLQLRGLRDGILKHVRSLKSLKQPVENWDKIILIFLSDKLDSRSLQLWEESKQKNSTDVKVDDLVDFLQTRCSLLENIETRNQTTKTAPPVNKATGKQSFVAAQATCYHCQGAHPLHGCPSFEKMSIPQRETRARELKLCLNCLRTGHFASTCRAGPCKKCKRRHNTLLHPEYRVQSGCQDADDVSGESVTAIAQVPQQMPHPPVVTGCAASGTEVLLCTARVRVTGPDGTNRTCRALLDSGSQVNFMSQDLADALRIRGRRVRTSVIGIGSSTTASQRRCEITVSSRINDFAIAIDCSILQGITSNLPSKTFNREVVAVPQNLMLADPEFNTSAPVDLLLGSVAFWRAICAESATINTVHFRNSMFGWLIAGAVPLPTDVAVCGMTVSDERCQQQLQQFWELEDVAGSPGESIGQRLESAHTRTNEGRFVVQIPFTAEVTTLDTASSRRVAVKRLRDMEFRFSRNPALHQKYVDFMREYADLGHMSPASASACKYYLPHHAVVNPGNPNKIRVVFDGSMRAAGYASLNDVQDIGPKLINDLFGVVLRFRCHKVVVAADIPHMYRQILVDPDQRGYQAILWRETPTDCVREFVLNTVTYGTSSAPYLAMKCLRQLADECQQDYPRASNVILSDFYVDDVLTGGETEAEVLKLCHELELVLKRGGFGLHKWASNRRTVLSKLAEHAVLPTAVCPGNTTKTLGVQWHHDNDAFGFKIDLPAVSVFTKRGVLSEISRLFDPLGLLGPLIVTAKILLQELWQYRLSWDDPIPDAFAARYRKLRDDLPNIQDIRVPRFVFASQPRITELHGFSDASTKAYGACIYLRSVDECGEVRTELLCAKSRVAPIKPTTVPRLELCGALELAKLMRLTAESMKLECRQRFWCDSQVVLCWLRMRPAQLNVFVSNRVKQIQDITPVSSWSYVNTAENPADLISRGVSTKILRDSKLWFAGPEWLSYTNIQQVGIDILEESDVPEMRQVARISAVATSGELFPFSRFSDLQRLLRATAYVLRFITKITTRTALPTGCLTNDEMENASLVLIRLAQRSDFANELVTLKSGKMLDAKSPILCLAPFIDKFGILRVGGRLRHSELPYDQKHPALLSPRHHISTLIVRAEHRRLLHAGPQQVLYSTRQRYWIVSGRSLVRRIIKECITCRRFSAKPFSTIMADLPADRVRQQYPFYATGIDFAGPFMIKEKRGRGAKDIKIYISLFVCLATKCIHLEPVSALSTDGFLAALRRFIARRGHPREIYTDNGRNFVGAKKKVDELQAVLAASRSQLVDFGSTVGCRWHFIPPYSPHFGGLWEAGVKSAKRHLKRVVNVNSLVFEEFLTLVVQIEAILNSRPLYPASSDPHDLTVLSPAHFLIGRPATMLPNEIEPAVVPAVHRYRYIQQLQQAFWDQWRRDYLNGLQSRTKWKKASGDRIEEGMMVLIRENNLPPAEWRTGRIVRCHPGRDGVVRVATVRTTSGETTRAIAKLSPLLPQLD